MKNILAGSLALSFAACVCPVSAKNTQPAIDSLYEQGQQQMAPNWRGFGKTVHAAVFIHNEIRKANNGLVAVWTHHELAAPEYFEKEKAYLSKRARAIVDCKSSRLGMSDTSYYSSHFGRGALVWMSRVKNAEMLEVVPDSIEEQLVKVACAPKPRAAPVRKAKKQE